MSTLTQCPECGFTPQAQTPDWANRAALLHLRRIHGIVPDGEVRDCQHPGHPHEHGDPRAYIEDHCRCAKCRNGNSARGANRRKLRAYGRWDRDYIPAGPTLAHIEYLRTQDMTLAGISERTGVSRHVVSNLIYGRGPNRRGPAGRVSRRIADAIQAVRPEHTRHRVPPTGTRRRLQALAVLGYGPAEVGRRVGVCRETVQRIQRGIIAAVEPGTEAAVKALYEEVWDTLNIPEGRWERTVATRTRAAALRAGWVPPLCWDDDTIDDPAAAPSDAVRRKERRTHPTRDVIEDMDWLHRTGTHPDEAAARMGMTRSGLEQACYRAHRTDLAVWIHQSRRVAA